jgi:Predicted phosphatases
MQLYVDLDGTLIDVAARHYKAYSTIAHELGFAPLSFGRYWSLKRSAKTVAQILAESEAVNYINGFKRMWLRLIEQDQYLDSDTLLPGATMVLQKLRIKHTLVLVTLRRSKSALIRQMERLQLTPHFDKIISAPPSGAHAQCKASLIRRNGATPVAVVVGDTEADILAGKTLGLISCAVTTGLRSVEFLTELKPDYIMDSIADVPIIAEVAMSANSRR